MAMELIALDLDGTLVGTPMVVPQRTRQALRSAMKAGCQVTLATGRSFASTAPIARELHLNSPLILCQGALIQDHRNGAVIHRRTIPLDVAREVAAFAKTHGLAMHVHLDQDRVYADHACPPIPRVAVLSGMQVKTVDDLPEWLEHPPLKFLFYGAPDEINDVLSTLEAQFDSRLQIVQSWHHLVEITALKVSKGEALAWLASRSDVPQSATLAVGDQDNDASMLAWAGLGIAMHTASRAAKAAADVIAPPWPPPARVSTTDVPANKPDMRHDEGVAWAIQRYVLGPGDGVE